MSEKSMTYTGTGVNYDAMDPFKRMCQMRGARTALNCARLGVEGLEWTRGESIYVFKIGNQYFGRVEEGLGTKNLVADLFREWLAIMQEFGLFRQRDMSKTYYDQLMQCVVAMIVNDMATLGISPIDLAMHLAVGSSDWFLDQKRAEDVVEGWGKACDLARCVWSCGETPTLRDIIIPGTAVFAGSSFGIAKSGKIINPVNIRHGDVVVFIESSGIHANALTLAREIAEKLARKYLTILSDGRTYGETLLDPTHIYCGLVEDCLDAGIDIHYAINITGHGWRKLMRANQPFTYVIETLPTQLPIFDFLQEHGPVDDEEAYGNLNMGVGYALYTAEAQADQVIDIAKRLGKRAFVAGHIEDGDKKVVIKPKGIEYTGDTLAVR